MDRDSHKHSFTLTDNLLSLYVFGVWGKPEHPEQTQVEHANSTDRPGLEPGTFSM